MRSPGCKRPMETGSSLRAKKSAGPKAGRFFTLRSARSIFGGVHAAAENGFIILSPMRRRNLSEVCSRGFLSYFSVRLRR